jgi:hypothetical protein
MWLTFLLEGPRERKLRHLLKGGGGCTGVVYYKGWLGGISVGGGGAQQNTTEAVDMNGRFQMQGGKNWISAT